MCSFANYWENEILDHLFMKGAYTALANIWVGLSTAVPLDDASGLAEPVGDNYSRVSTAGADWDTASGGALDNANAVTFPEASGNWGTITHFALFDASTAGNMLAHGSLAVSKSIISGDTPNFAAGVLDVTLD